MKGTSEEISHLVVHRFGVHPAILNNFFHMRRCKVLEVVGSAMTAQCDNSS
jgi:hypothetical protein